MVNGGESIIVPRSALGSAAADAGRRSQPQRRTGYVDRAATAVLWSAAFVLHWNGSARPVRSLVRAIPAIGLGASGLGMTKRNVQSGLLGAACSQKAEIDLWTVFGRCEAYALIDSRTRTPPAARPGQRPGKGLVLQQPVAWRHGQTCDSSCCALFSALSSTIGRTGFPMKSIGS